MASQGGNFELTIADPLLLALYRYWRRKAGDRRMPRRDEMDPIEMKPWLSNMVLIEFMGSVEAYRVKLEGTNIEAIYGNRRTGRGIEALTSESERELMMAHTARSSNRGYRRSTKPSSKTAMASFHRRLSLSCHCRMMAWR